MGIGEEAGNTEGSMYGSIKDQWMALQAEQEAAEAEAARVALQKGQASLPDFSEVSEEYDQHISNTPEGMGPRVQEPGLQEQDEPSALQTPGRVVVSYQGQAIPGMGFTVGKSSAAPKVAESHHATERSRIQEQLVSEEGVSDANGPSGFMQRITASFEGMAERFDERRKQGDPLPVRWERRRAEKHTDAEVNNNEGEHMGVSEGTFGGNKAVAVANEADLGFFESRDREYAKLLATGDQADKYQFLPRARSDASELLHHSLPESILHGPAGQTLEIAATREAEAVVMSEGHRARDRRTLMDKVVGDKMPNKQEFDGRQRMLAVVETAGRRGVEAVVDLSITDDNERSLAAARTGLGALGIEVHVDTLRGRHVIDGIDAARKIAEAQRIEADGSTYRNTSLLGIHVRTDEVDHPGGEVKDFETTLFVAGQRATRQLITMRPVTAQSAGREPEVTMEVYGAGIDPEIGEYVVRSLGQNVETERVSLGNGVDQVTTSQIAANMLQMVEDISDPYRIGRRVSQVTPTGRIPLALGSASIEGDSPVVDVEIVEEG
ncbi:MAG TPA: hypothetical protein VK983_03370 [Candidatus Limnocylindrales bacterium]|nr:hypothetical protein [Candidatus Limnocylindrales bacterium]